MGAFQQVGEVGCLVCPPKLRSSGPGLPLPRIRPIVMSHTKCRHPDICVGPGPPFKLPRPRSQRSVKSLRHASSSCNFTFSCGGPESGAGGASSHHSAQRPASTYVGEFMAPLGCPETQWDYFLGDTVDNVSVADFPHYSSPT